MELSFRDKIRQLAKTGQVDKATEILVHGVTKLTEAGKIKEAVTVRNLLLDINPMALTESIQTAEQIEAAKISQMSSLRTSAFDGLREHLTAEEFANFFYCATKHKISAGTIIFKQGSFSSSMFLVESGTVRLSFHNDGNDILVAVTEAGHFFGCSEVFSASIRTLTASALTDCVLFETTLRALQTLQEDYPAVFSKVYDHCLKVSVDMQQKTANRRVYERFDVSRRMLYAIVDMKKKSIGTFRSGELLDLSAGGTAFIIRADEKLNGRSLLGVPLILKFPADKCSVSKVSGQIVSVRKRAYSINERSIHVKFSSCLSDAELQSLTT